MDHAPLSAAWFDIFLCRLPHIVHRSVKRRALNKIAHPAFLPASIGAPMSADTALWQGLRETVCRGRALAQRHPIETGAP